MKRILSLVVGLLCMACPIAAHAFCGFYVSGADSKLFADATQVVLMREGTRTVLSMQNDYKGPPADFALVVPVPVVLQKENVKTLAREVFDRVDKLASPRLVEYWEQDPCSQHGFGDLKVGAGGGSVQGFGSGHGRLGGAHTVKIEAQFEVGEYEIVILSAQDSSGLDAWLRENNYKIPEKAEPALRPYVQAGSKFFVAKVNVTKVKFDKEGRATLSPLRFHYDTDKFELPVKLGMLNSSGTQDLIVHILAPNQRYVVANYPNATIPTNIDVAEAARPAFGAFYASLLDKTLEKNPGAVVTEYAWGASNCDPCPGGSAGLSQSDIATLGGDVLPSASTGTVGPGGGPPTLKQGDVTVSAGLPKEIVQRVVRQQFGRFRLCYENGLRSNPSLAGKVTAKFKIDEKGEVISSQDSGSTMPDNGVTSCIVRQYKPLNFPAPEGGAKVDVTYTIEFSPGAGASPTPGGRGGGLGLIGVGGNFILTRLHARYGKDSLAADLVFKAAEPIVGGREIRSEKGDLETGAKKDSTNNFQARYAIRHEWKGPIACKDPVRGRWGGPWPKTDADGGIIGFDTPQPAQPITATKTAYAARSLVLASYVPKGVPELGVVAGNIATAPPPEAVDPVQPTNAGGEDAKPPPVSADASGDASLAPVTTEKSKCGCRVIGTRDVADEGAALGGLALAVVLRCARRARGERGRRSR
jgi:hypothetical protein